MARNDLERMPDVGAAPGTQGGVLITGGAGFIGSNLADRLLRDGRRVRILDNLTRPGVERNLAWLQSQHAGKLQFLKGDVRNAAAVREALDGVSTVFHLAAQVAVTTSLVEPLLDFEVNVRGTINVLEAARAAVPRPKVVLTSTNKVYGGLPDVELRVHGRRYEPVDRELRQRGISERRPLDFHSPYGCSKGAADQYVLDYARTMGLDTLVFRMSCIYGPRQFGTEDQGWVAHFLLQALRRRPLVLYGDGRQVRDVLFVQDLVEALCRAEGALPRLSGQAFNMGGGPAFTLSLLELLDLARDLAGRAPQVQREDWRPGDQRYYVSDTRKFAAATGWQPQVAPADGVRRLFSWLRSATPTVAAKAGGAAWGRLVAPASTSRGAERC